MKLLRRTAGPMHTCVPLSQNGKSDFSVRYSLQKLPREVACWTSDRQGPNFEACHLHLHQSSLNTRRAWLKPGQLVCTGTVY